MGEDEKTESVRNRAGKRSSQHDAVEGKSPKNGPREAIGLNQSHQDGGETSCMTKSASEDFTKLFSEMNPRWKNWWIRGIFTLVMISGFLVIINIGIKAMVVLIFVIQVKCYHEIISVGHQVYQKYNLPWFRTLSWYFLGSTNYFFYGEFAAEYFSELGVPFRLLLQRHRLISFLLYVIGIMMFVLSLKKNYYKVQFALFGWYQITLLIVLTPSHLIIQNMLNGLIWFFLPVSMVICNDIFAYIFGFFFGRTRLIKLSPKKTWEGFLGGFLSTVIYGLVVCEIMCQHKYFVCPPQMNAPNYEFSMDCSPSPTFQRQHFVTLHPALQKVVGAFPVSLLDGLTSALGLLGIHLVNDGIWMYPMILHGVVLACFSSLIAPFGGFFASGFKRAFKIKDFADTIPGHGGIMDRFDCQYLMATFVNVYIASVIRAYNPNKLLHQVMFLDEHDQLHFYRKLQEYLVSQGTL